ncbi:hypothetical protein FPQ18DRAFT_386152 [Pyronema domesticum]|nr:hypothetical protein FPQ18DRAFT_386152 [Pyronema domesticum]
MNLWLTTLRHSYELLCEELTFFHFGVTLIILLGLFLKFFIDNPGPKYTFPEVEEEVTTDITANPDSNHTNPEVEEVTKPVTTEIIDNRSPAVELYIGDRDGIPEEPPRFKGFINEHPPRFKYPPIKAKENMTAVTTDILDNGGPGVKIDFTSCHRPRFKFPPKAPPPPKRRIKKITTDIVAELPTKIILGVGNYCDASTLANLRAINKRFNKVLKPRLMQLKIRLAMRMVAVNTVLIKNYEKKLLKRRSLSV